MFTTLLPLLAAGSALALPAPQTSTTPSTFSGIAIHSGSDIQYAAVSASGSALWLNKPTSTYCPSQAGSVCATSTNDTVFAAAQGSTTLSLNVIVPGGQEVYVAADGRAEYTVPHSASTGTGSSTSGFSSGDGYVKFEGNDWLACPEDGAYAVYAASKKTDGNNCLGFEWKIVDNKGQAWEYA
ncbi:hypothetical protein K461DRAFT_279131 [Myriangium duriaei CBS 260.36]|uniref:Uncharacterized protein n=1 Tax=Myriangium duriaei CBS 260.36 TaxID=1168546 RepID=A0A9P4MJ21_9PEZI|nr:hypothetical protein K461DRAFT_279131 [Myriangium duriaei CBS 260.36]